jgi:hypothetical protein
MSVCLSLLFIFIFLPSVCLSSIYLSVCPSLSVCLSLSLLFIFIFLPSICLSARLCLSVCLSARLCLSICLSVCPSVSVYLSVCLPVCVCLSVCLSVSLLFIFIFSSRMSDLRRRADSRDLAFFKNAVNHCLVRFTTVIYNCRIPFFKCRNKFYKSRIKLYKSRNKVYKCRIKLYKYRITRIELHSSTTVGYFLQMYFTTTY